MSSLFRSLTSSLGINHIHTALYHPISNSLEKRFHLKQFLKCQQHVKWRKKLQLLLLFVRSAFKKDLQCTVAELVYGSSIRLPGEFISPENSTVEQYEFLQRLWKNMHQLSPRSTSNNTRSTSFVYPELQNCSHVFLRHDGVEKTITTSI